MLCRFVIGPARRVWLGILACLAFGACAHEPPPAARPAKLDRVVVNQPPAELESARAFLPTDAVLIATVAVAELDALGFAQPLLAQLIDPERAAELVYGTLDALIAVSPHGASTRVVLVLRREDRPADEAAWQRIGTRLWLACVESCDGYGAGQTRLTGDTLRDGVGPLAQGGEAGEAGLAHVQVAIGRDAAVEGVRARLLDSSFSVLSELHVASLDVLRSGDDALRVELSARFGSAGLASNAALLLLGLAGSIADRLEAAGLQAEADQLMALHTELVLAPGDSGEAEKCELRASLSLPLVAVPAVALAFQTRDAR
jgi:hypothetical protein